MIPRTEIAALLASALGQEKSVELVASAARELGYGNGPFSADQVRGIFGRLAKMEGLVGVVARFAVSRGDVDNLVRHPADDDVTVSRPPASYVDLMPLLAPTIGAEKARDSIDGAAARLGFDAQRLDRELALAVLEELAKSQGIVGVVARFAKARFLLS